MRLPVLRPPQRFPPALAMPASWPFPANFGLVWADAGQHHQRHPACRRCQVDACTEADEANAEDLQFGQRPSKPLTVLPRQSTCQTIIFLILPGGPWP